MSVNCTGKANMTHQVNNRLLPMTQFYISDSHNRFANSSPYSSEHKKRIRQLRAGNEQFRFSGTN